MRNQWREVQGARKSTKKPLVVGVEEQGSFRALDAHDRYRGRSASAYYERRHVDRLPIRANSVHRLHVKINSSSQRLAWFRWSQTSRYIVGYIFAGAYLSLIMSPPAAIPIVLSDTCPRNPIQHLRILWVHRFLVKTFGPVEVLTGLDILSLT
jgi:hypothetical protein